MDYAIKVKKTSEYLGKLVFSEDQIDFVTHHVGTTGRIRRKHFVALGDVVYFLFIGDKLMKIGKAAGAGGWYSRMNEYTKNRYSPSGKEMWDRTTQKIYNFMRNHGYSELEVYAVQSPRTTITMKSFVTSKEYVVDIETAEEYEQNLIQEAMLLGEDLPFCREIKK